MNDQEIQEIKERCIDAINEQGYDEPVYGSSAYRIITTDVPKLFAEVKQLKAEKNNAVESWKYWSDCADQQQKEIAKLRVGIAQATDEKHKADAACAQMEKERDAFKCVANTQLDLATQYKKELDAAVEDLNLMGGCPICMHNKGRNERTGVPNCAVSAGIYQQGCKWKWRRAQEG